MDRSLPATKRHARSGAVALEMALILPVFLLIIFGIFEFGRAMMVQQILTNGAREGARRAIVPGATDQHVTDVLMNYFANTTVATADFNITPSLATAQSHDEIRVTAVVDYSDVGFGFMNWFSADAILGASVVMRKE